MGLSSSLLYFMKQLLYRFRIQKQCWLLHPSRKQQRNTCLSVYINTGQGHVSFSLTLTDNCLPPLCLALTDKQSAEIQKGHFVKRTVQYWGVLAHMSCRLASTCALLGACEVRVSNLKVLWQSWKHHRVYGLSGWHCQNYSYYLWKDRLVPRHCMVVNFCFCTFLTQWKADLITHAQ